MASQVGQPRIYLSNGAPWIRHAATPVEFAGMNDLPPLPQPRLGRYRHYKGGEYEVVGVARHSETLEPLVIYRPLYNASGLWARPHAMFFGEVEVDGQRRPRFAKITAE